MVDDFPAVVKGGDSGSSRYCEEALRKWAQGVGVRVWF